jgi:sortase A
VTTVTRRTAGILAAAGLVLAGCAASRGPDGGAPAAPALVPVAAAPGAVPGAVQPAPLAARPSLALSWVSIPSIGVRDLRVVAYVGRPDDLPGTQIEDRGLAASPRGSRGGVGPGVVGNFIVTGHRTAAGAPLRRLPELRVGAHVLVRSGSSVFDYVVTGTLSVSFRSAASMALQSAAVPGRPGRTATQAMITLSTCATPEDHAHGDWWRDALGNPEHRIDKVGVLVDVRPV